MFAGDRTALVVLLALSPTTPTLFLPGEVLSATEARLVRWRNDLQLGTASSTGRVTLDESGEWLRVRLFDASLQVGACPVDEYLGRFVGMISDGTVPRPVANTATAAGTSTAPAGLTSEAPAEP